MAATAMFQRRNIDLFKTIILRLPRSRFFSADSSDEEQPNENISDDPETVLQGKKLDLVVPSLRVDRVLASALGIGRRSVVNNKFSMLVPYIGYKSLWKLFETPRVIWYIVMINRSFRKYPYYPHRRDWNFLVGGGLPKTKKIEEMYEDKLENYLFPKRVGGGIDIFWNMHNVLVGSPQNYEQIICKATCE